MKTVFSATALLVIATLLVGCQATQIPVPTPVPPAPSPLPATATPVPAPPAPTPIPPEQIVTAAMQGWDREGADASQVDATLAYFADDATFKMVGFPPDIPADFAGKAAIRQAYEGWLPLHPRLQVKIEKTEGNTVTATTSYWSDPTRAMGVAPLVGTDVYVVKDGKIVQETWTLTDQSRGAFAAAWAKAAAPAAQVIARGAPMHGANGLYFDKNDRLYIASFFGREIVVMDPDSGKILDRIGTDRGVETPDDLTFGPDGSLYWTALGTGEVGKLTPDGKKVTVAQGLMGANPITFSDDGRLFVARDFLGAGLYELDPNGVKPPRPIDEKLVNFNAFDFGPDGKLYGPIFTGGKLVAVDVDSGAMRTVAEGFKVPAAVKFDVQGRLFALDQAQGKVFVVDPASGQKTEYATIEPGLDNLAFDSKGRLFVSNANTGAIYEVRADGTVRTVSPGGFINVAGIAVLPRAGGESVYLASVFSVAELDGATGQQRSFVQALIGASPLQGPTTLAADGTRLVISSWLNNSVQVWDPAANAVSLNLTDVAVPLNAIRFQGDIVVAELGAKPPRVVRISAADPTKRTTLAEMGVPAGLAATAQELWATDWAAGTVVQIVKGGQQLTPPAVVASGLKGPEGLAVAPDGSLLVVEGLAGKLSRIDLASGTVSTVAEGLELGAAGPPTMPPVWRFDGVAVGPSGAIYVGGDKANVLYRIEVPTATTPSTTTTPATAFPTGIFANAVGWTYDFKADGRCIFQLPEGSAVGTYTVTGNQVVFSDSTSNAPWGNCEGDRREGTYTWAYDGKTLSFKVLNDRCGLREGRLTSGSWTKQP